MNCDSFVNVLDLHLEKRLSPRLTRRAAEHLALCASCRALAAPAPAPTAAGAAPSSLKARLLAAAKGTPVEAAPDRGPGLALWPREARGIALAAALLLAVGLLVAAAGVPSQSSGVAAVEEP